MIKLYRGIIDIFVFNSRQMDEMLTTHIRHGVPPESGDFGAAGFWNFLLEVVMLIITKIFYIVSLSVTTALAIVFFPLHAIKQSVMNLLDHRAPPFQFIEPTEDGNVH
jgi:hypothetical protein